MKEEILKFLKTDLPQICVLATSSKDAKPQSAVMGYTVLDDLTLILSTHKTSRKWKNLMENPEVALVFGWDFTKPNVQYEGVAELLESGDEFEKLEETYFNEHPQSKQFKDPQTAFIKVKPTWIRFSDYSQTPVKIEELNF